MKYQSLSYYKLYLISSFKHFISDKKLLAIVQSSATNTIFPAMMIAALNIITRFLPLLYTTDNSYSASFSRWILCWDKTTLSFHSIFSSIRRIRLVNVLLSLWDLLYFFPFGFQIRTSFSASSDSLSIFNLVFVYQLFSYLVKFL